MSVSVCVSACEWERELENVWEGGREREREKGRKRDVEIDRWKGERIRNK